MRTLEKVASLAPSRKISAVGPNASVSFWAGPLLLRVMVKLTSASALLNLTVRCGSKRFARRVVTSSTDVVRLNRISLSAERLRICC